MTYAFQNPGEYSQNATLQFDFATTMLRTADIQASDRVLDIGCGDGKITADIARLTPHGEVIGADISSPMIQFAKRSHAASHGNLSFCVMDAEKNIFINRFHRVVSFCCLHWVQHQGDALTGIKNALVPGGTAILLVPLRHEPLYTAIEQVAHSSAWQRYFTDFYNPHIFFSQSSYYHLLLQSGIIPQHVTETIMTHQFSTQGALEGFLQAWLPHIHRLPTQLRHDFIREIGNVFIEFVPPVNHFFLMPLRMLHVQAIKPQ